MTAPSKNFTSVPDASIDVDSPWTQEVTTQYRDNDIHLEEWLGASYTAAQDHNHDGVNSALIEVGPNFQRNGSFESGLTVGWDFTQYTGGSYVINSSQEMDGQYCVAITSTSTVNGGGDGTSANFTPVSPGAMYALRVCVKASVINVSSRAEFIWYDDTQSQISTSTVYSATDTNTTMAIRGAAVKAPTNAKFAKVKLTGGVPGSGSATGTIYFDGVIFFAGHNGYVDVGTTYTFASSTVTQTTTSGSYVKVKELYSAYGGLMNVSHESQNSGAVAGASKVYINGAAAGTEFALTGAFVVHSEDLYVAQGDLVQVYAHNGSSGTAEVKNLLLRTASLPPVAVAVS